MIREATGRWGRRCEDESTLLCQSSRGFNAGGPSSFRMSSGVVIAPSGYTGGYGHVVSCRAVLTSAIFHAESVAK